MPLNFTSLLYKSFENTVGKGEIAHNEQFLLFPECFLPIWKTLCHFHQNRNGGLQTLSVWKSLKFAVGERVYPFTNKPWFFSGHNTFLYNNKPIMRYSGHNTFLYNNKPIMRYRGPTTF